MKGRLIRMQERASRLGGKFYHAFFKCEDGLSYRTCLYPSFGNFQRWKGFIGREGVELDGLVAKRKGLIDADSFVKEIK